MPGTNVWSVVFVIVAALVAVLVANALANVWRRYINGVRLAHEAKKPEIAPSWVGPLFTTIVVVGGLLAAGTLGWDAMVNVTTTTTVKYVNPAMTQEHKKVMESELPSSPALDAARAEQKARQQIKPHEEALSAFDKAMADEAAKIKARNQVPPATK